ncbi:MAG: DUF393 domain-containing protein [Planctomycetales bacterium]|nr:DUF393 domain-containing protein [Planctomycetales bacterium]
MPDHIEELPIVFYDGECGLCHRFVQFMLRHDAEGVVRFAALQGETYRNEVQATAGSPDMTTVILWDDGTAYFRSDAVLRSTRRLGGFIGFGSRVAAFCPRSIRDAVYEFVSRNRFRWFGKADQCRVPLPSETSRFLP